MPPPGKLITLLEPKLTGMRSSPDAYAMTGYLVSLLMGLAVGGAYGLVQVRSPAPPMITLIGLFGTVLGEQAVDLAKRRFVRPAQTSLLHEVDGAHASLRPGRTDKIGHRA